MLSLKAHPKANNFKVAALFCSANHELLGRLRETRLPVGAYNTYRYKWHKLLCRPLATSGSQREREKGGGGGGGSEGELSGGPWALRSL